METASESAPAAAASLEPGAAAHLHLVEDDGRRAPRERVVAAAYRELGSMRKVAGALRISTKTVHRILKELGVERLPSGQRPKHCELDLETRRNVVAAMYEERAPQQAIADTLRVAKGTVRNDLKAKGVERRRPGRPAKYPPPEPRKCAWEGNKKEGLKGCDVIFTPRKPSDAIGPAVNEREALYGRFCSYRCWGLHRIWALGEYPPYFAPTTDVVSGRSRRKHKGRAASRRPPKPLAKARGDRGPEVVSPELVGAVEAYADRDWGYRTILKQQDIRDAELGEYQVRKILREYRRRQTERQPTLFSPH